MGVAAAQLALGLLLLLGLIECRPWVWVVEHPLRNAPKTLMFWWSTILDRNEMRKIGYARVSSAHQQLDRQISALRTAGCDLIFREKASGKSTKGRPELEKAIIHERGALLKALDRAAIDLTDPIGQGLLALLSGIAQAERQRIVKRANEGRVAARQRGAKFGRKPKLTDHQQAEALKRLAAGESCRAIGRTMGVHHATIARLAG